MCAGLVVSGKNGVTIGENAVVGACTLVNKDIPDGATAVGVPCRIIEKRVDENEGVCIDNNAVV